MSKDFGSLQNKLMAESKQPDTEVGMGITLLRWSDRHAYKIIEVSEINKAITIQRYKAVRKDKLGMSDQQNYEFSELTDQKKELVRKGDQWYEKTVQGLSKISLLIGVASEYYDYSF